jgi:ribonuclease T2
MPGPSVIRGLGAALLALVLTGTLAGAAHAAAPEACAIPRDVTPAPAKAPPRGEIRRDTPAAAYLLVLSWSPEFCRAHSGETGAALQCRANSFGFIVHGLWPDGRAWGPSYCRDAPPLDMATLKANLCMTPSPSLLQHEWAAHGTCAWNSAGDYFAKARALRAGLDLPDPTGVQTAGQLRDAFLARNRGMTRDGLDVRVGKGNRLTEVRVCYDLNFRFARCLDGTGAPDRVALRVTPRR